jgi:5-methylcytosine-specific restriction protein A
MYDVAALLELIPAQDRLAAAQTLVEAVIDADPSEMGDGALTDQVLAGVALAERVEAAAVLTVGVWEPRKTWCGSNARSARSWLASHADLGTGAAQRLLRCGRMTVGHDQIAERLRDGRLSCRKVALLADAVAGGRGEVFARDEAMLVEHAARLSHDQAAHVLARWKMLADDSLADRDHDTQVHNRSLHHSRVGNQWRTDATSDLWSGAIIDAALRDAMDGHDAPDREGGQRSAGQRRHDALVKIAEHWLSSRNQGKGANPVATVNIHVTARELAGTSEDRFDPNSVCDLYPGGPVPRSVVRAALTSAYVGEIVFSAEREVLNYGRLRRCFTAGQRRAIIARDGPFCAVPGCRNTVDACDAHHLVSWNEGGHTDVANGAMVCRGNHTDITTNGAHLARGPNPCTRRRPAFIYTAPNGTIHVEATLS